MSHLTLDPNRTKHAYLFCSAPFSPFALDVLGPAADVGELAEADADMCQKRGQEKRKGGEDEEARRREKGRKLDNECSRCSGED